MSLIVRNQAGHSSGLAYHRELYWSPDIFRLHERPTQQWLSITLFDDDAVIYMEIQTSEDHHTLSEWPSTPRGEDLSMADEIGTPRKCHILHITHIHVTDFRYIIKSIAYNEMKWELPWVPCDLAFVSHSHILLYPFSSSYIFFYEKKN